MAQQPVVLVAGPATATVAPDDGARLRSLTVDGLELLHQDMEDGSGWTYGSFVMAPWAGRIRDGLVHDGDRTVRFPRQHDGHGLHGLVHSVPWTTIGPGSWAIDLPGLDPEAPDGGIVDAAWLAPLHIEQHLRLHPDRLDLTLEVTAATPVPATVGWHPWFRRRVGGADARLELPASYMLARDAVGITTEERVAVPPEPWDDAFGGLTGPIAVQWGEVLRLELDHDGPITVVYTGRDHAVCVEPQTGPPDEVNRRPRLVRPQEPLRLTSTWRWTRP